MKIVCYEEAFGEVKFPEGFAEKLKGLSLDEQMACYRTTEYTSFAMTDWNERTMASGYRKLENTQEVRALIVRDGMLVGVMMRNDNGREVPCLPEERICTYFACDNNGAGSKSRIDYTYLVCVPEGFDKAEA